MKRISLKHFSPLIGLALFFFALFVLNRALGESSYRDILRHVSQFPAGRILGAIGLTAASYFVLTLYDHLALRYLRQRIGLVRVSLASFISYCFSRNIGFAVLTGGSIRYRFYSAWGLSAEEVARLITFAATTFILGLLTMGGSILLLSTAALPDLPFPVWALGPLGVLALVLVFAYLLLVFLRRRPFRIRNWNVSLPTRPQSFAQLLLGSLDWVMTASVLYYLLSGLIPLSLVAFLEIYLIAQLVATMSHVPGGLGVFESVIVLLIPQLAAPDLLAMLLVYRGIYYLLPFASAILLLGALEGLQHAKSCRRLGIYLGNWLSSLAPPVFAGAILFTGAILLFSCATPTRPERLEWLRGLVPLALIEISHFLLALAGAGLLLLARGLQRRLQPAYVATLLLLSLSVALTLLKGMTIEQAIVLVLILAALIPSQDLFYRHAPLREEPFPLGWVTVILTALGTSAWLAWISYDHRDFTAGRVLDFALHDDAARSLRALAGAAGILLAFCMLKLRLPRVAQPGLPDTHALQNAEEIISRQSSAEANLALVGDKALLFSQQQDAFIMYASAGRFWVTLGDPVGARHQVSELAWCFRDLCERQRGTPLFYLIEEDHLPLYLDMGMALLKIGEEARLDLQADEGSADRRKEGRSGESAHRFQLMEKMRDPEMTSILKRLGSEWLGQQGVLECGFSQGGFESFYLERFPIALVHQGEELAAFALVLPGPDKKEFTIDLLRFSPQGGTEAADALFRGLMDWGRKSGFRYFNLGVVPNADHDRHDYSPSWRELGPSAFRNGQSFSSTQQMRRCVERLQPRMCLRYLALPGQVSPRIVLENVASLIRRSAPFARGDSTSSSLESGDMYCATTNFSRNTERDETMNL